MFANLPLHIYTLWDGAKWTLRSLFPSLIYIRCNWTRNGTLQPNYFVPLHIHTFWDGTKVPLSRSLFRRAEFFLRTLPKVQAKLLRITQPCPRRRRRYQSWTPSRRAVFAPLHRQTSAPLVVRLGLGRMAVKQIRNGRGG